MDKPLSPIYFLCTVGTRSLTSEGVPKEFRECTEVDPPFSALSHLVLSGDVVYYKQVSLVN